MIVPSRTPSRAAASLAVQARTCTATSASRSGAGSPATADSTSRATTVPSTLGVTARPTRRVTRASRPCPGAPCGDDDSTRGVVQRADQIREMRCRARRAGGAERSRACPGRDPRPRGARSTAPGDGVQAIEMVRRPFGIEPVDAGGGGAEGDRTHGRDAASGPPDPPVSGKPLNFAGVDGGRSSTGAPDDRVCSLSSCKKPCKEQELAQVGSTA